MAARVDKTQNSVRAALAAAFQPSTVQDLHQLVHPNSKLNERFLAVTLAVIGVRA